jgi:hypothetical protein
VATAEKPSPNIESKEPEPEAPAEGPRVVLTETPPAAWDAPSAAASVPSDEASPSPAGEQAIDEKPAELTPAPKEAAANAPATSEKPVEPEKAVSSSTSPPPKSQMATPPQANRNLTIEEVIMLANAELRKHGYDRAEYLRQEPQFDADHGAWSVSYDPMTFDGMETAGQHFSVVIDDRTKGAVFLLRK